VQRAHRGQGLGCVAHQAAGVRQEDMAGLGEPYAAAGAVEERGAEFPLQLGDLVTKAGLGDMAPGRRAGEVMFLLHGDGELQLAKIHLVFRSLRTHINVGQHTASAANQCNRETFSG